MSGEELIRKRRNVKYLLLLALSISLLTYLVYLSSLENEFVEWDDSIYVFRNPHIRSFNLALFKWAFLHFYGSNWHPLVWISHAIDYAFWGLNPLGHHLTNIILHAINTFLVVLLIAKLIEAWKSTTVRNALPPFLDERGILIAAGATGLFFGLHPLHVESVAWVAERKDLLCALFFLASIMAYVKYAGAISSNSESLFPYRHKHYLMALGFFVLALLSKPMAVTLPVILLLLDWYPFKRIQSLKSFRFVLIEKLPFVVLSLLSSIVTIQAQKAAMKLTEIVPLSTRLLVAAKSLLTYIWNMLLPLNLLPFYHYPKHVSLLSAEYLFAATSVIVITMICIVVAKSHRLYLSLWAYYVVTLIPVIGIIQVGSQSMADRYTYLPSIGPFLMMGLVLAWCWNRVNALRRKRAIVKLLGISMFMLLSAAMTYLTFEQIGIWKDSITLWSYFIEREPESVPPAYYNRGMVFDNMGRFDKAIEDFDKAIALNPSYLDAYNNRGLVFEEMGKFDKAIEDFDKAIALNPSDPDPYYNRGVVFTKMGKFDKAIDQFDKTIKINPQYTAAYAERGKVYIRIGNKELAVSDFQKACDLGDGAGCRVVHILTGG